MHKSKGGRPRKHSPVPRKWFFQHVNLTRVHILETSLRQKFPTLSKEDARGVALCVYQNVPIQILRRELNMGVGNKPKFDLAVLLRDIARVLANHNGRTVPAELNTISGYNDERVALGLRNLSQLEQIARVILSKLGKPYCASLRQQARNARAMIVKNLP